VLAEVDLDVALPDAPPRRRPLLAAAAVAALLALVAAAALRSALTDPPLPARAAVTAWVALRAVVPGAGGGPDRVDLVVTMANRGGTDLTASDLTIRGPRAGTGGTAGGVRHLPAGGLATLVVRQQLACRPGPLPGGRRDAGLDVTVRVTATDVVVALPVGRLGAADGACRTAAGELPEAYAAPVRVERAVLNDRGGVLRVAGLPADVRVVEASADGIPVPVLRTRADATTPGTVTLDLAVPDARCDAPGTRGVVPVGLQLRAVANGGLTSHYAAIGPALARWLLAARTDACRQRDPAG
jgi:hypothetical protein